LELTASLTAIANTIAHGLTLNELALAAGIFVQIGDTLATIAAHRAIYDTASEPYQE
jgi:hypothetical protein